MMGIIDVGGGLRGIYGAGIVDWCLQNSIHVDRCYGVSAGSANLITYLAQQPDRLFRFYSNYAFRKEYMSFHNLLTKGSYVDLDYVYGTLTNQDGEDPLDFKKALQSNIPLTIVATDAETGKPVYFDMKDMKQDHYDFIKASSCVPVFNKPFLIDGHPYYDGAISDPIPLKKAFEDGCDRVILVLTRPRDYYRSPDNDEKMAKLIRHRYPSAARDLADRAVTYNRELDEAKAYEEQGKVLILAPDNIDGMNTLKADRDALLNLYRKGYQDAAAILPFLNQA
jgi:predicted patatin/cPLA2 family phospholipase